MQPIKLYLAILCSLAISACGGGGGGTTDTTLPKISAVSPASNLTATGKLNDTGQTASQCYRWERCINEVRFSGNGAK
jgi:hypothetical protein